MRQQRPVQAVDARRTPGARSEDGLAAGVCGVWISGEILIDQETFHRLVSSINEHDVAAIAALMTPDHVFVDSLGNRVEGAGAMEKGWRGYFAMCPDYWIRADQVLADGALVLATGEAGGTIDGVAWRIPAAWKAMIRDGKVAEWRVFADNKPVYEILARRRGG